MNILHIIDHLDVGGAQVRLLNDVKFMDRKKFNNTVCSLNCNGKFLQRITSLGIKVHSLNGYSNLTSILKLASIIRKNHFNIIHTQLFFADHYGRLLGKVLKVPAVISTVQSVMYEPNNKYLYSLKRKLLDKYSGKIFNKKFIAVSETVKDSISRHLKFRLDKIEVIPNYVDIDELNCVNDKDLDELKKELSLRERDIVLITVGRLNSAKGVQYLLKALSKVVTRYKFVKLLIVGGGFYRTHLDELSCGYGLKNNVVFLGERDDIKELLHISDIFVFPTLSEGLPISLLEAMAIGMPSAASDISPVRELITDDVTGLLFKPKDSEDIKRALIALISNPDKAKKLGQKGKDLVKSAFNPTKNVKLLEELYARLI